MNVELHKIPIRDVFDGYVNNDEEGVIGYGGRLDIRPKYQREFVYDEKERNAVIDTIQKNFPLNVMYWAVRGDGGFEVLDGQQRTISFCQYVAGAFSIDNHGFPKGFPNLTETEREQILDYKLMIYFCDGNDKDKLDWFRVVNIAGKELNSQELRNSVYTGAWLTDAKRKFSKTNCVAYGLGRDYMKGSPIHQDFLQTTLGWINNGAIEDYMRIHQLDTHANDLWLYYQRVINWVKATFPKPRKDEMRGVPWGPLYNNFGDMRLDPKELEIEIAKLMMDEDVTNKKGIYQYVLDRDEYHLNIRKFSPNQRREAYERQNGICIKCSQHFDIEDMEADHITSWKEGGKTTPENCQMLCKPCNGRKSDK